MNYERKQCIRLQKHFVSQIQENGTCFKYSLSSWKKEKEKCSCREFGSCLLCVCPYILWTSLMIHAAIKLNENDWGKCWGSTCNCVLKLVAICLGVCVVSPNDFWKALKRLFEEIFLMSSSLCAVTCTMSKQMRGIYILQIYIALYSLPNAHTFFSASGRNWLLLASNSCYFLLYRFFWVCSERFFAFVNIRTSERLFGLKLASWIIFAKQWLDI